MNRFEVQQLTICDGWTNTWTCWEGDSDDRVPETFSTFENALSALDQFLEEMDWEFENGNIESPYNRNEFRIVEVAA